MAARGVAYRWAFLTLMLSLAVNTGGDVWVYDKLVEKYNQLLLLACFALLLLVFVPGLGVRVNGARRFSPGTKVKLAFDMSMASLFDTASELRI